MRILITGHLGYIGTVLTPMLQGRFQGKEHEIVGLDSDLFAECTFGPASALASIPMLRKDIRDVELADVAGFDVVIHLAALPRPIARPFRSAATAFSENFVDAAAAPIISEEIDPALTCDVNHGAAVRLAELARRAGAERFLFASSCTIYGSSSDHLAAPIDGNAPTNPVTTYDHAKLMAERDIADLGDAGFSPVFLRCAETYGISPRLRLDLPFNRLFAAASTAVCTIDPSRAAAAQEAIRTITTRAGDEQSWRPLTHIRDVARAFIACLECDRDRIHNKVLNICATSESYRPKDLIGILIETIPEASPLLEQHPARVSAMAGADGEPWSGTWTGGSAGRILGDAYLSLLKPATPQWTAQRGAEELAMTFRHVQSATPAADLLGSRFRRAEYLRELLASGAIDEELRVQAACAV